MTEPERMPGERRAKRIPLSRKRVLVAALSLADEEGLESMSMRRLGQALGVEAMSLYKHVANKDDILDGLVDLVFGEIDLPSRDLDWKTALRARAVSAGGVLVRHPWAAALMESRLRAGPSTLRHHDAVLGCLREAGFSVQAAAHAYSVMDAFIYGFALQQTSLPFDTGEQAAVVGENLLAQFEAGEYPYLAEMTSHAMQPGYDYADEFAIGLDLILAGLERLRDSA